MAAKGMARDFVWEFGGGRQNAKPYAGFWWDWDSYCFNLR
jgi:hypothetical protein